MSHNCRCWLAVTNCRVRRRGLSMIELLVILAIIGVLVALILPAVERPATTWSWSPPTSTTAAAPAATAT